MNIKNLKVKTQLRIGFAIIFIFVLGLGVMSWIQTNTIVKEAETMYSHPFQVSKIIAALNADMLSMRVGIRDLLLANTDQDKEAAILLMEQKNADIQNQFDRLGEFYLGPEEDVDEAYKAYINWETARSEIVQLALSGDLENAKKGLLPGGKVGIYREKLLDSMEKIEDFANNKADSLYQSATDLNTTLQWQLILLIGAILVLTVFISVILLGNIEKPLNALTEATDRFQNGDRRARSSYAYKNEFGTLSASFNALAENIQMNMALNQEVENFTEVMLGEEDAKKFFRETLSALAEYTGSQMAAVYLLNRKNENFEHFESIGLDEKGRAAFSGHNLEGEFGASIAAKKYQHIKDIPEDTRFVFYSVSGKFIPREIITIPILFGEDIIAVISLASIARYSDHALIFVERTMNTMSARIEGILAYQTIKDFSEKLEDQNRELDTQKTELEEQSAELTQQNVELEMQKKQLNEASRLKTNFLSNMSHELRTPLNSVIALSGILNRRLRNHIPEEEYSYLEVIERNGKNLLLLINDILDISRIEAGREDVEITEFNVNRLINEVVEMIQPQAHQKNIELVNATRDMDLLLASDGDKCRHILENLIGNAVKFTEKGKVEITTQKSGDCCAIIVNDTGIGMDEKSLPFIFDEFRQADGSTSRKFGGTGLGLAIAKKYANLLGGTITVKSSLGEGSEFVLSLPQEYASENRIVETQTEKSTPTDFGETVSQPGFKMPVDAAGKTILIVEDSEPAVIQIKDLLEESGYRILVAKDAYAAFEIIEDVIPDAMLLDLMMPGIDGFEVLKTLREAEKTAHIPVLILTAKHITKEELKLLTKNNVHQLIQKGDVNRAELENAVTEMLFPKAIETKRTSRNPKFIHGKPMVMVVEDNPDNMITAKALLEDEFIVLEAVDGNQSIEMAKEFIPDLILMDIALPGINGIEAFKRIRALPALRHIPVIALTASAMTQDREGILAQGFDSFIPKPIMEKHFLKIISEVLYGK